MSEPFLGEIRLFSFNFAPKGWAFCNGQIIAIAQNTALFSLLGTTYGGNGSQTFALPDMQSRAPMHWGTGDGGTPIVWGQASGAETVTLLQNELPAHTHYIAATNNSANSPTPNGGALAAASSKIYNSGSNLVAMAPTALSSAGGSQPHNNLQPLLAVTFCIALQGIFPSRN